MPPSYTRLDVKVLASVGNSSAKAARINWISGGRRCKNMWRTDSSSLLTPVRYNSLCKFYDPWPLYEETTIVSLLRSGYSRYYFISQIIRFKQIICWRIYNDIPNFACPLVGNYFMRLSPLNFAFFCAQKRNPLWKNIRLESRTQWSYFQSP